jgi:hypothetical protein
MMSKTFHGVLLAVILPVLLNIIVYYGFSTSYTRRVFHEETFRKQYEHGIYKYRVLGRTALLETHAFLNSGAWSARIALKCFGNPPPAIAFLDKEADGSFYAAYFIQNTIFLVCACFVLYLILANQTPFDISSVSLSHIIGTFLMVITQYVISPYDTLSYFLILGSFFLILRPFRFSYIILLSVLILSTLARESSALALSFYFACHFKKIMGLNPKELWELGGLVGTFFATYILIRLCLGTDSAQMLYRSVTLKHNFTDPHAVLGIVMMPVVAYLICAGSRNLERCLVFILASLPYLLAMLVIALGWETRLWVPVWLGLLILTRGGGETESSRLQEAR